MRFTVAYGARLLLGLIFVVFGLNAFYPFLPLTPPPMGDAAMAFVSAMMSSGYFMQVLAATEVIAGLMLVSGFASPLALVILAPVTLQIFLFHAFLTPGIANLVLPAVMGVMHVVAASSYWKLYRPLFRRE
ncbi:DoxX family membrane protein [Candidatus Woesearchaeota archaeon]|nr:DoxX family membrane protein [Candidatus Woesearchaeota archaeon]